MWSVLYEYGNTLTYSYQGLSIILASTVLLVILAKYYHAQNTKKRPKNVFHESNETQSIAPRKIPIIKCIGHNYCNNNHWLLLDVNLTW